MGNFIHDHEKRLVVYYSATGSVEDMAMWIAKTNNFDLYKIEPADPLTGEDLDWQNLKGKSSLEMKKDYRPEIISPRIENLDDYDLIYLGFPLYFELAPKIIHTFLEQYDWTGKTIRTFVTSKRSRATKCIKELAPSAPGAEFAKCQRFPMGTSADELRSWVRSGLYWNNWS
ncbi:MAG: flavodoxin [Anaerovoracaceae bacterium]